jgi:hypothetical protein
MHGEYLRAQKNGDGATRSGKMREKVIRAQKGVYPTYGLIL